VRKLTLASALYLLFSSGILYALGLGEIEVKSSLNQRLDAQIELLSVRGAETEEMIVTLASEEAFEKAGLERPLLLTQLRFAVQQDLRGKPYIQVTSQKVVVEPFLNFLIEIDWPRGRLVREYTLLLDPPVFMTQPRSQSGVVSARVEPESVIQPAPAVPTPIRRPAASVNPSTERASTQTPRQGTLFDRRKSLADRMEHQRRERAVDNVATERRSVPTKMASVPLDKESRATSKPVKFESAISDDEYGPVRRNETLWKIASRSRSSKVSVQQMMLAILRYNPQAFIDDNINLLKRGVVLRIPDSDEARSLTAREAIAQVGEHNALWRTLATQGRTNVAVRQPQKKEPSPVKIKPAPKEVVKAPKMVADKPLPTDRLSIQAPDRNTATDKSDDRTQIANKENPQKVGVSATVRFAKEELTSEKLRNRELRSEVADLEKTASKMDQLVSVQESELAEFQARLKRLREEREAAEVEKEKAADSVVVVEADVKPEPVVIEREETTTAEVLEPIEKELAPSELSVPAGNEKPIVVKEEPLPELTAEELQAAKTLPSLLNKEPEVGLIDGWLKEPQLLMGSAAGVLLLLVGWLLVRRKKMADESDTDAAATGQAGSVLIADDESADGEITDEDEEPNFANAHDETQALDQEQMEGVTREAREARVKNEQEDEGDSLAGLDDELPADELPKDDTIAEADVYLAYGLYPQSEDLLKGALRDKPDCHEYQEKLLETYFASKNIPAFEECAASFKDVLNDDNHPLWERVVVMGKELCPRNELFAGEVSSDVKVADLEPVKPDNTDFVLDETDIADVSGLDFRLEESLAGEELNLEIPDDDLDLLDDDLGETQLNDDSLLESADMDPLSMEEDALLDASIGDGLELDMSALDVDGLGLTSDDLPMIPEIEDDAEFESSGLPADATGIINPDDTDLQKLLSTNMEGDGLSLSADLSSDMLDSSGFNDELSREEDELLDGLEGLDTQGLDGLDLDSLNVSLDGLEPLPDLDETGDSQVLPSLDDSYDDLPSLEALEESLGDGDATLVEGPEELDDELLDDSLLLESMDDSLHLDSVADSLRIDGMDQTMDGASGFDAELDDMEDIIDDVDEVETMLEMAQAYLDMGDGESAQHSLNDVLASDQVTEQQKSAAQGLLKKLPPS